MKEVFLKSHIDAEIGAEMIGFDFSENDDWLCKNAPEYVLVKKVKNKEDQKDKKAEKRKGKKKNPKNK